MNAVPTALLADICQALRQEILALGFAAEQVSLPDSQRVQFSQVRDPYSGRDNLKVSLQGAGHQRLGEIQFNSDDGFFAEFDVVQAHPHDARWFVESVTVWGRAGDIKAEPKFLPAL